MAARRNPETLPFDFEELERLRTQSAAARSTRQPTAPVVDEEDAAEITIVGMGTAPRKPAARAATVSDPMTMSVLAEIERLDHEAEPDPGPQPRDSNRHIKPRG